ncbi:MAG: YihY/virulence factor BrkB family protein, partial [Bacteroidota bacterium]
MKLKRPDIKKWTQKVTQHPLRFKTEVWMKNHSFPGFFKVPIYDVLVFLRKELQKVDLFTRANAIAYSFFL